MTDDADRKPEDHAFTVFLSKIAEALHQKLAQSGDVNAFTSFSPTLFAEAERDLSAQEQLLVYALAKGGHTNKELSSITGYSEDHIALKKKEHTIRRAVSLIQHAAGLTDVLSTFKRSTPRALEVMLEIMNDTDVAASTRLDAANTVIERVYGKATAHIEANGNLLSTMLERLDTRDDEQTRLAKELCGVEEKDTLPN